MGRTPLSGLFFLPVVCCIPNACFNCISVAAPFLSILFPKTKKGTSAKSLLDNKAVNS